MLPPLLVFDSATDRLAVALVAYGRRFTADESGAERASARLLPVVSRLLAEAGLGVADLAAIGYGRGPGAFTGLRAACAIAQGLALARGLPVVPVDTLAAVAEDAFQRAVHAGLAPPEDLRVVQDARMGEVYAARWRRADAGWLAAEPPELLSPEAWNARQRQSPAAWVVGSALDALGDRLEPGDAHRDPRAVPSAAALAACMHEAWARGATVPPAQALPLYVRDKVAETTAERAERRAAQARVGDAEAPPSTAAAPVPAPAPTSAPAVAAE